MAKAIIILAVTAMAYGAALKNEGASLQRVARSPCSTCGPPPPPLLHTRNWSGLARSSDGLQNTIFSGAAAAANQGPLAVGEAFSLASSSAGAGLDESANSGSTAPGSSGSGSGSSSTNGAGFERSSGASFGGSAGVKDGAASGYGGGHKVSGGGFKESHYSYHSEGSKDFGAQGGSRQDGQVAALSPSSFAEQGGSFGGNSKDVAFGGNQGEHSEAFRDRGDSDVQETQNQNKGSFSGHRNSEHFEGHGISEQSNQQDKQARDFNTASSSGQSSSFGGNRGSINGHLDHGFSSQRNERGHGHGHFGSGYSSGQDRQSNSFGSSVGQGNFGSGSSTFNEGRASEFGRGSASQGHFESGFSSGGNKEQFKEQARYRPYGSQKQGRGPKFGAIEAQSSSAQGGLGSSQYQESSGNQGQLQASSGGGFGQGGFGSGSLSSAGQQGYVSGSGSGSSDAQSALSGALNLASQGLQTSSQAGCTTCGKSSYALSNAKSRSGSAVALSIGG